MAEPKGSAAPDAKRVRIFRAVAPTNDEYLRRQFAKKLREFSELNGDPSLHAAISRYLRGHRDLFAQCTAPTWCNNDFHEPNIIVTGSAVAGFIDVENAIAADLLIYHALELWDWFAATRASEPLGGLVVDIRAMVS
ncbi:MAG: phosphotransferase [Nakamurella sp.]